MARVVKKDGRYQSLRFPINHWEKDIADATTFSSKTEAGMIASSYDVEPVEIIIQEKSN